MTHSELVEVGRRMLARICAVVVTEVATQGETPDVLGWRGAFSVLIECKASRADFLADKAKPWRHETYPPGGLGHTRYFLCEPGVIEAPELPAGWGLIHVLNGGRTRKMVEGPGMFSERNLRGEVAILLSVVRRIGQTAPKGVSIRAYASETQNTATVTTMCDEDETERTNT